MATKSGKSAAQAKADGGQSKAVDIGRFTSAATGKLSADSKSVGAGRTDFSGSKQGSTTKRPGATDQYGRKADKGYRNPGENKFGGPKTKNPANNMGSKGGQAPKGTTGQGRGSAADVKGPRTGGGKSMDKQRITKLPFASTDKRMPKANGPKPLG